jgi:hypothetical protein
MEHPRGFSDLIGNRAAHGINIYQQILICQETMVRGIANPVGQRNQASPQMGLSDTLRRKSLGITADYCSAWVEQIKVVEGTGVEPATPTLRT